MYRQLRVLALGVIFLAGSFGFGECSQEEQVELDKIVVTPYRTEQVMGNNQEDIEVVGSKSLDIKDKLSFDDSVQGLNGVDAVGAGKFGSASEGLYIRGGLPRHTAYMLEGLKLYDPSNTSGYYVPSDFLVSGIQRIEITKMPLSSLYGSSPLAGVVNFFMKTPQGKPYVIYKQEAGSFSTVNEALEFGGKLHNTAYLFNVDRLDTKGFSKAMQKTNPENDAYQNTNISMKLDYRPDENFEAGFVSRLINSRTENDDDDDYDGIPEDDLNNISHNSEFLSTAYLKSKLTDMLSYKIQAGTTSVYRRYQDDKDNDIKNDNYVSSWYRGKTYQLMNHFEVTPAAYYKALVGFDYTEEVADSYRYDYSYAYASGFTSDFPKKSTYSKGIFIENILNPIEPLQVDFSYRLENSPIFKSHSVIKERIGYKLQDAGTELYSSYSEGFKAPSLYQLFDPSRGNRNLKPEESKTWETGLVQPVGNKLSLSFCYFHSDFKNLVDFVYTNPTWWIGEYKNAAKAKSRGVEVGGDLKLSDHLRFKAGYTYTSGRQDFVDDDLVTIFKGKTLRIPTHKATFGMNWKDERFDAGFDLSFVGLRTDRIWVGTTDEFVKMKPYILGGFYYNYNILDNTTLFVKINNIFDQDYERIKGFQEESASFYGGVKVKF